MTRRIPRLPLLSSIALVAACSTVEPSAPVPVIRLVPQPVPAEILRYGPRPAVPPVGTPLTAGQVAEIWLGLEAALDDREDRLDAVARLQAGAPAGE